jgi:hypothetical protein
MLRFCVLGWANLVHRVVDSAINQVICLAICSHILAA